MKPLSLPSDVNPADTMFLANAGEWSWLLMKVTGQVFLRRTQKVLSRQGEQKGEPDPRPGQACIQRMAPSSELIPYPLFHVEGLTRVRGRKGAMGAARRPSLW